ncbi:MAG: hypothetical protein JWM58_1561 [Rhizobium sp.]|nr:hypothetical protein [Rhizobium sp.]
MANTKPTSDTSSDHGKTGQTSADSKAGRFLDAKSVKGRFSGVATEHESVSASRNQTPRRPGRFKGTLSVGPEFFEGLTTDELSELTGV